MPFTMDSAAKYTKKASTPAKKKQFAATANSVLKKTGDDVAAIKIANAAVKKSSKTSKSVMAVQAKSSEAQKKPKVAGAAMPRLKTPKLLKPGK